MQLVNISGRKTNLNDYQDFRSTVVSQRIKQFYDHSKSTINFHTQQMKNTINRERKSNFRLATGPDTLRHQSSQYINQKDTCPKKCLLNNNFERLKSQLYFTKQDKRSLKMQYQDNMYQINLTNHQNYKFEFQNDKDKQMAFDNKVDFQKLLKKTQEIQKVIEITKNHSAQLMDYNEKKLEQIKNKEEQIIELKKQNATTEENYRLQYNTNLKNKRTNKKLQDKDNLLKKQLETMEQKYLDIEYQRNMCATKLS